MAELIATLADLSGLFQDPVHRAQRTEVRTFVQQSREGLGRRLVAEALRMQVGEDLLPFAGCQGAGRARPRGGWSGLLARRAKAPVQRSPRHIESAAGGRPAHRLAELVGGVHKFPSPVLTSGREIPSRADTFFCTSMMSSACWRRRLRRAFSVRSRWFSSASGWAVDLRPRLLGAKASSSPCSRWRRQVVRWDE